ncbi:MAG TPA: Na/Pi cotransporter family protein [Planctomycetota bacterium]|nr:Na/Pi cotransporter family protein [Planctomycetota bacterium]
MNGFTFSDIVRAVGGIALFLLGMRFASDGLKGLAGRNLRIVLGLATRRRLPALAVGGGTTFLLQSSTAATIMIAGLVNAGLLDLFQAAAVVAGTCIGSTLIVQLIAFDLGLYALLGVAAGLVILAATGNRIIRGAANALIGFGLIFYAIGLIRTGLAPLAGSHALSGALAGIGTHWYWFAAGILGAAALSVVTQSSVAVVAIAFGLAREGTIDLLGALAFVFGAHLGAVVMPLLAGIGWPRRGKQVVLFGLLLRTAGVLLFAPLSPYIVKLAGALAGADPARAVAWEHTIINVGNALVALPFLGWAVSAVTRLLPERDVLPRGVVKFVDPKFTDPPQIAIEKARKEINRMGLHVADSLVRSVAAVEDNDAAALQSVRESDDAIDLAFSIVSDYLGRMRTAEATPAELAQSTRLLYAMKSVELAGDVVSKDIVGLGLKKERLGVDFSVDGSRRLREYLHHVDAAFRSGLELILSPAWEAGRRIMETAADLDVERREVFHAHFEQVQRGVRQAQETSTIYADLLAALQQVARYSAEIAETMTEHRV